MGYTITKINNGYLLQQNYNTMYSNGFGYPTQSFYATLDEVFTAIKDIEQGGLTSQSGNVTYTLGETRNG